VALVVLGLALASRVATAQTFSGPLARKQLCQCLADAQLIAEEQGRLDFTVSVESAGSGDDEVFTARITTGLPYAVGRINFTGHSRLDDGTLRRAMLQREHDVLDLRRLRRSIERINDVGVFEPLTLDDVSVDRLKDGVTVDVTIALRERKSRWWSISSSLLPGSGALQAQIAWRLPPWGRGLVNAATSFISLNAFGVAMPILAFERPLLPGQEWLSGFVVSPQMSLASMARHYARIHATHAAGAMLDGLPEDSFSVPVVSLDQADSPPLVCNRRHVVIRRLRQAAAVLLEITKAAY